MSLREDTVYIPTIRVVWKGVGQARWLTIDRTHCQMRVMMR